MGKHLENNISNPEKATPNEEMFDTSDGEEVAIGMGSRNEMSNMQNGDLESRNEMSNTQNGDLGSRNEMSNTQNGDLGSRNEMANTQNGDLESWNEMSNMQNGDLDYNDGTSYIGTHVDGIGPGEFMDRNGDVKKEREISKNKDPPSTDRGWAWVILVAATIEYAIVIGHMKCGGIFFVEWQERFQSSASATSIIQMIRSISYSITALLVMTFGMQHMSCRASVMFGAVLGASAYMIAAFAEDIGFVYLSHGVLDGMSLAFIQPAIVTMINTYFNKYRGLTNNISCAGVSIGGLALAPLYTKLFPYYGYTGTFMIGSGIVLNVLICGALLRPIGSYSTRKNEENIEENAMNETRTSHNNDNSISDSVEEEIIESYSNRDIESTDAGEKLMPSMGSKTYLQVVKNTTNDLVKRDGSRTSLANIISNNKIVHYSTTDICNCSLVDLTSSQNRINKNKHESESGEISDDNHKRTVNCRGCLRDIYRVISTALEFRVLKNPLCIYYLAFTGFLCIGHSLPGAYLVPHAKDLGIDNDRIATLLMVICILDLIGKLTIGFISDRAWVRRSTITAMASAILGVACHLIYFLRSFETLLIFTVVLGLLQGVYFTLHAVIIVDYLSLDNLKPCLGFTALVQGIVGGVSYPLAGLLRDITGTYQASYHLLGMMLFLGAGLCGTLPIVQRWLERRQTRKHGHNT